MKSDFYRLGLELEVPSQGMGQKVGTVLLVNVFPTKYGKMKMVSNTSWYF